MSFDDYSDWTGDEDDRDYEMFASLGDPRRCPRHPSVAISSPDGMFDGLCPYCESEMAEEEPTWCPLPFGHPALGVPTPPAPPVEIDGDDIPF
jgi:hypothetical protein